MYYNKNSIGAAIGGKGKVKEKIIKIRNLNKYYGKKQVLNNVNLEISNGMFGLLGKNGAGKTTLMKIIASLLVPTDGECIVHGIPVKEKKEVRKIIGYIPQEFSLYPDFSCYEMLDYFLLLEKKKNPKERQERIFEVLEQVNLSDQLHVKIKNLSGGMKRRMGVAQALLSNPKIIIADEPTVGLDPEERAHLRNLFRVLAKERVVLLSTHIIGDIEDTCDQIAIMQKGNVLFQGTIKELKEHTQQADGTLEDAYLCITADKGR